MKLQERLRKLEQANKLIFAVKMSLSKEYEECSCCQGKKYHHWEQAKVREMLNGCLSRLEKSLKWMGDEPDQFDGQ